MTATGQVAFANARVRGMKSRLLGPDDRLALRSAADRSALVARLGELGVPVTRFRDVFLYLFARLIGDYRTVLRSYPDGRGVIVALLRLHEIENLKTGWRALTRSLPAERWLPCWRPLGDLATLDPDDWRTATSLRQILPSLERSPYAEIAAATLRAHERDPTAAEIAFDAWASRELFAQARRLPRREAAAARLALSVVRERDYEHLSRAALHGFPPDPAVNTAVMLPQEERRETLQRLADWRVEHGPLGQVLSVRALRRALLDVSSPPAVSGLRQAAAAVDWTTFKTSLRRARRRACRRAFLGPPFRLAPAVALLLLKEEEVRGVNALAEAAGIPSDESLVEEALAASAMGA